MTRLHQGTHYNVVGFLNVIPWLKGWSHNWLPIHISRSLHWVPQNWNENGPQPVALFWEVVEHCGYRV